MPFRRAAAVALTLSLTAGVLAGVTVQKPGLQVPSYAAGVQEEVKNIFSDSYTGYRFALQSKKTSRSHADFNILRLNSREYAFGHDNLAPISKTFVDDLGGYGATAVDALDAMVCKFIESLIAC